MTPNTAPTARIDPGRRNLIKAAAAASAAGLVPGLQSAVHAQGSDKPEKEEVRIGFIPLTDCASVVMASVLGFDKKYGIKIMPVARRPPGPACATSSSTASSTWRTCSTA